MEGTGMDCSGLVEVLLLSVGAHPHVGVRLTAQGLYDYFSQPANHISQDPQFAALVFWGKPKIHHVAFCMTRRRMLEAGSGDETVTNLATAIQKKAISRVRPIRFFEADYVGCFMPEYDLADH